MAGILWWLELSYLLEGVEWGRDIFAPTVSARVEPREPANQIKLIKFQSIIPGLVGCCNLLRALFPLEIGIDFRSHELFC